MSPQEGKRQNGDKPILVGKNSESMGRTGVRDGMDRNTAARFLGAGSLDRVISRGGEGCDCACLLVQRSATHSIILSVINHLRIMYGGLCRASTIGITLEAVAHADLPRDLRDWRDTVNSSYPLISP